MNRGLIEARATIESMAGRNTLPRFMNRGLIEANTVILAGLLEVLDFPDS